MSFILCSKVDGEAIVHPLERLSWQIHLTDSACSATLSQEFKNASSHEVCVTYAFPNLPVATVCGISATYDNGTIVTGHCAPKHEARQTYHRATAKGKTAALLEQSGAGDVLRVALGRFKAGARVTIIINMALSCEDDGSGLVRLAVPTGIGCRYPLSSAPDASAEELAMAQEEAVTIAEGCQGQGRARYDLSVQITMPSDIVEMHSAHQGVRYQVLTEDPHQALASLTLPCVPADDVVLTMRIAQPLAPRCMIEPLDPGPSHEKPSDQAAALAIVHPNSPAITELFDGDHDTGTMALEFVFVVDRSGSMSGGPISRVAQALQLFLRSLPIDCRFNVIGFGSSFTSLFPTPVEYSETSLQQASAHAAHLAADLGGTEIEKPLAYIFSEPPPEGFDRRVFLLTDGSVSNINRVLSLVKVKCEHSRSRLCTVGIGNHVSHALVDGLAEVGGGTAEYVAAGEAMEAKIVRQLRRALRPQPPVLERVEWVGREWTAIDTPASPRMDAFDQELHEWDHVDLPVVQATHDGGDIPLSPVASVDHLAVPTGGYASSQCIGQIGAACNGQRITIAATLKAVEGGIEAARLHFRNALGQTAHLDVPCQVLPAGRRLHACVGRVLVSEVEASMESFSNKKAIIEQLGVKLQLLTNHTSMVVVSETPEHRQCHTDGGGPAEALNPIHVVSANTGCGEEFKNEGVGARNCEADADGDCSMPPVYRRASSPARDDVGTMDEVPVYRSLCAIAEPPFVSSSHGAAVAEPSMQVFRSLRAAAAPHSPPCLPPSPVARRFKKEDTLEYDKLRPLVLLQAFDGAWALDEKLLQLLNMPHAATARPPSIALNAWATALVVAFLQVHFHQRVEEWGLVADKAMRWLQRVTTYDEPSPLVGQAKTLVRAAAAAP